MNSVAIAQSPSDYQNLSLDYPDERGVFLENKERIAIGLENGQLSVESTHFSRLLFLKDEVAGNADRSIRYSSFNEILDINARTLVPEKGRYRTVKVEDIRDEDRMSGGVFYDDVREKVFVFPGLEKGAIAELEYSERIIEPRFLGAFYFNSHFPVMRSEFEVSFAKGISLKYILLGENTDQIVFSKTNRGGKTIYKWSADKQEAMTFEANAPSLNNYEPHVIVYIDKYGEDGEVKTLLSDVNSLYSWYRDLTRNINEDPGDALREITLGLIEGAQTDEEKVRRIFHWVQDNIRYIAFEDGLGGFIPREAEAVCTRKYGDCKDMASITTEMLKVADVTSNLTWIGTRDIPYSYEQVPTPMVDNHMIASTDLNGERIFLDATDEFLGFGYPSAFIQGKQALVGMGDEFELFDVPIVPAEKNRILERAEIRIDQGVIKGSGYTFQKGYPAFNFKRILNDTRKERMAEYLGGVLQLGNNKFKIPSYEIIGLEDRDQPLEITFGIIIPDYARALGEEIYLNMNLDRRWNNFLIDTARRKRDREFEYMYEHMHEVIFEIPEGYSVDYLPEAAIFQAEGFGFEIKYRQEDNKVILNRKIELKTLLLLKTYFDSWNDMIATLDRAYQEVIVLKKL
ncbi:MAG: hypothetical protein ACI959_001291 [Limisphaerales bacterium]|jgi:hypothetical protein